jgi:ketosteroid isomerase-like protein
LVDPVSIAGYSAGVSENLELVRSIYAAWERGDFSSADWADAEIVYGDDELPDAGTVKGKAAMARRFRSWLSVWQDWRVEAEDYVELNQELVLVPYHFSARGKTSGVDVGGTLRVEGASLFCLRGGKVWRLVQYFDRDRALADLGLEK